MSFWRAFTCLYFEGFGLSPNYLGVLWFLQINAIGEPFLNVNCKHLKDFDEDLYRQLINYPQEVVPTFDMAVNQMFFDRFPDASLEHQIQVRPFSVDKTANMRSLNPEGKPLLDFVVVHWCKIVEPITECTLGGIFCTWELLACQVRVFIGGKVFLCVHVTSSKC